MFRLHAEPMPKQIADRRAPRRRSGRSGALLALSLLLPALSVQATIYRVGADADCTHPSLAAALAAAVADSSPGPHEIRLVVGGYSVSNQEINNPAQDLTIRGGFPDCAAASPGSGMRSTLSASNVSGRRVLRMFNHLSNARRTIRLERLSLTGGNNPSAESLVGGGGILAMGRLDLHLVSDTRIDYNTAENGGGIGLFSLTSDSDQFTRLYIRDGSSVCSNEATGGGNRGNGGGIHNLGGASVIFWHGRVCENSARRHGGGIHLANDLASVSFDMAADWERAEFIDNEAGTAGYATNTGFGGAIFSDRAPIQYASGLTPPGVRTLRFRGNTANFGGAIHVQGADGESDPFTNVELRNAELHGNLARAQGGALFLRDAVDMRLYVWGAGACGQGFPHACVDAWNNVAENAGASPGIGAGGFAALAHDETGDARRPALRVAGALFQANRDPNGTAAVIDARGDSSVRILRSVFINNEANGHPDWRALIESRNDVLLGYSTVLANAVTRLFWLNNSEINTTGSILYAPGVNLISGAGASMEHGGCLLAHTTSGIPPEGVQVGAPALEVHNGFAPKPRSRAIDACVAGLGDNFFPGGVDAHRLPVPYDLASVPNLGGSFDLGAIEQRDALFYGGFGTRPGN